MGPKGKASSPYLLAFALRAKARGRDQKAKVVMMPNNGCYFSKLKLQVKAKVEAKDR